MTGLTIGTVLMLLIAAFAAGWLDAIGGGGGLIQLPVLLLLLPHSAPAAVLGTNKLSSIIGTTAAARTYAKTVPPPRAIAAPMMLAAFIGAGAGSAVASSLDPELYRPVIVVMLVGVWIFTFINPAARLKQIPDHEPPQVGVFMPVLLGFGIGFYDGAIGPGTGTFLLIGLVAAFGLSFLRASSTAKFVNVATNLASILVFAATGSILWLLGLLMGAANLAGGIIGSRTAIRFGSEFVRRTMLVVIAALIVRLGITIFG